MKISVSSYSFSQYTRDGKLTLIECILRAKEMGFDAIEFTDLPGETLKERLVLAEQLHREAERLGIEINAYAVGGSLYWDRQEDSDAEVKRLCEQVDVAAALGAKVMRHDVCYRLGKTGKSRSFDGMLPTIAQNARRITAYAESVGVRTCTENHGFIAQDSDRMERLFNAVDHDNYGLLVDMGNFLCVDEDPITAVSRLAPYAIHAHIKDMRRVRDPKEPKLLTTRGGNDIVGAVVGEGDVPVKQCLSILKRAGYDGYVTLEYEAREDCLTGIARGLANTKQFLSEL